MGISETGQLPGPIPLEPSDPKITRTLFISDRNGVFHKIRNKAELKAILAQMTPEELAQWKLNYRFATIENSTGNNNYTGTSRDI